jgi:hypothetical protein
MTQEDALARCAQLNADDSIDGHWFPRQVGPDIWDIVSVIVPRFAPKGPLQASIQATPRPAAQPDPRPSIIRSIPPYGPA